MNNKWLPLISFVALLVLCLTFSTRVQAEGESGPYTTTSFTLPGGVVMSSSPAIADLDGDGKPEVLIGTTSQNAETNSHTRPGMVVAMRGDGSILWARDLDAPVNSTPAVGDLDGDGSLDIVVGVAGDVHNPAHQGGVVALDRFGSVKWRFQTQDKYAPFGFADGVFSSPSLCDVDGDSDLEIAFGGWDHHIYLLDHLGRSLWNNLPAGAQGTGFLNGDTVWSSPACSDLNSDGRKEIIIGADISHGGILPDGTRPNDGGFVYVIDASGQMLVRRYLPEAIYSSPAIGDLDGDGSSEIVVGTSFSFWLEGKVAQPYVYAFSTREIFNGGLHYAEPAKLPHLPGWPRPTIYPGYSSPALSDLDGDGDLEIIIGSGNANGASEPNQCDNTGANPACHGAVYAWHHDGSAVAGFPMWPKDYLGKNAFVRSSPTVVDLDADGQKEIIVSMLWDLIVIDRNGNQKNVLHTTWTVDASPAVTDADGDGKIELWIGGGKYDNRSFGHLWRFEHQSSGGGSMAWPMFRHDIAHTAHYAVPALTSSPVVVMHQAGRGGAAHGVLPLRASGSSSIQWSLISAPAGVTLAQSSGALRPGEATILVRVESQNRPTGRYALGNVRISAVDNDSGVALPTIEVPVSLLIGRHTYLPLAQ